MLPDFDFRTFSWNQKNGFVRRAKCSSRPPARNRDYRIVNCCGAARRRPCALRASRRLSTVSPPRSRSACGRSWIDLPFGRMSECVMPGSIMAAGSSRKGRQSAPQTDAYEGVVAILTAETGLRPAVSVTRRNHDPDQGGRSTAAQGIRAESCSTRFLGWTLRGWVAALVRAVGHRDPNAAACCSRSGACHQ